jgi:hypothetical protein
MTIIATSAAVTSCRVVFGRNLALPLTSCVERRQ